MDITQITSDVAWVAVRNQTISNYMSVSTDVTNAHMMFVVAAFCLRLESYRKDNILLHTNANCNFIHRHLTIIVVGAVMGDTSGEKVAIIRKIL